MLTPQLPAFPVTGATFVFNVAVDPTSKYLYIVDAGDSSQNPQVNGQVYGFNINSTTGAVGAAVTGSPVATQLDPFGIAIDATGVLIAVDNNSSNSISLINIGTGGALSTPTTVTTGVQPLYVTFLNAP